MKDPSSQVQMVRKNNVFQRDLQENPMILSQLENVHEEREEVIPPNDVVASGTL